MVPRTAPPRPATKRSRSFARRSAVQVARRRRQSNAEPSSPPRSGLTAFLVECLEVSPEVDLARRADGAGQRRELVVQVTKPSPWPWVDAGTSSSIRAAARWRRSAPGTSRRRNSGSSTVAIGSPPMSRTLTVPAMFVVDGRAGCLPRNCASHPAGDGGVASSQSTALTRGVEVDPFRPAPSGRRSGRRSSARDSMAGRAFVAARDAPDSQGPRAAGRSRGR